VGISGKITVPFGVFVPVTVAPVEVMVPSEVTSPVTVEPLDNVMLPWARTSPVEMLVFAAENVVPDPTALYPVAVTTAPVLNVVPLFDEMAY
jgi:hypothetical protein